MFKMFLWNATSGAVPPCHPVPWPTPGHRAAPPRWMWDAKSSLLIYYEGEYWKHRGCIQKQIGHLNENSWACDRQCTLVVIKVNLFYRLCEIALIIGYFYQLYISNGFLYRNMKTYKICITHAYAKFKIVKKYKYSRSLFGNLISARFFITAYYFF